MPIGKEKKIFTNPIHVEGGVMFHCLEIKGCKEISTSQRAPRMPALNTMNHAHNISSDLGGCFLQ